MSWVGGFWAIKFSIKTHVESVYFLSNCSLNYTVESSLDIAFIMQLLTVAS